MSKIDLVIPTLKNKFFDLRDSIPGDAYTWSWVRPLTDIKYLALHHTASVNTQTPEEIAKDHIDKNGWGGIGYHFLVDKEGKVFYVGDISTARANVANMNESVIGIGLIGNFTEGRVPTPKQIDSAKKLCEFFINEYPDLKVVGHKDLPGQSTLCPGDIWGVWKEEKITADDPYLLSQVENLQTSLGLLHQQRISLQEALQQREKEIMALKSKPKTEEEKEPKIDTTLTIMAGFINLYKLILPRKAIV